MSDQGPLPMPLGGKFTIPKHVSQFFESVEKLIPGHILGMIVSSKPDNDRVTVVSCKETSYARWRKHKIMPGFLKDTNWKKYMGLMRDQGGHDTCWAVVTAELISAIRFILKYDTKYTEYSAQYLVDYADPAKASGIYRGPTSNESVFKALHAVSIYGIEVVNGETIALVKSTHGEELGHRGYFRVSLDTMIVEVPCKGKTAHRDLAQPCRLLSRFCFPKLPPRQV